MRRAPRGHCCDGDGDGDDAVPRAFDAHAHAQIDASLDVIETLMVDLLDITRPIAAPMQQMLLAQQNAELSFAELPSPRQLPSEIARGAV